MSDFDVHPDEMADQVDFESFTERVLGDLRMEFSSGADPTPPPALAAVLAGGLGTAGLAYENPAHQGKRRSRVKHKVAALAGQFAGMTAVAKMALAATAVGALAGGGTLATSMISADHPTPVVTVETSTTMVTPTTPVAGANPVGIVGESEQGDDSSEVEPGTTPMSTMVETDDQDEASDHESDADDTETDSEDDAVRVAPAGSLSPSMTTGSDDDHESGDSHDGSSSGGHDGSGD